MRRWAGVSLMREAWEQDLRPRSEKGAGAGPLLGAARIRVCPARPPRPGSQDPPAVAVPSTGTCTGDVELGGTAAAPLTQLEAPAEERRVPAAPP